MKTRLGSSRICKSPEKLQSHKSRYLFLIRGITVSTGLSPEFMTQEGSKPLAFHERCSVLKKAEGAGPLNAIQCPALGPSWRMLGGQYIRWQYYINVEFPELIAVLW